MYKNGEMFPSWVDTLGSMLEAGKLVRAYCAACKASVDVDIPALIKKVGRDFCLVDRRPPCRTPGCSGRTLFMYQSHGRMAPLQTERVALERMLRVTP